MLMRYSGAWRKLIHVITRSQKSHGTVPLNMKFLKKFPFYGTFLSFLDWDLNPDSQSGSGSTDPLTPDADPNTEVQISNLE
jgi:hypothetical protein